MANCLVKKVKVDVNNDNLVPMGYVKLFTVSGTNVDLTETEVNNKYIRLQSGKKLLLIGDGYFYNDSGENVGKEYEFKYNDTASLEGIHVNSGKVMICAPYNCMRGRLIIQNEDSSEIFLKGRDMYDDINSIIQIVAIGKVYVEVADIKNLTFCTIKNVEGNGLEGSVSDYVRSVATYPKALEFINCPLLTGRLEDMFDTIAAASNDGSDCAVKFQNCPNIYWQGTNGHNYLAGTLVIANHSWTFQAGT